jgi:type II secretory pathway pseudopilin PulG
MSVRTGLGLPSDTIGKRMSSSHPLPRRSRSQQGYILLTLLLLAAVLAIAAAAMVPLITFQIKRDREEEMIHRGVQYSRAVRRYFKKFGRYPTRIEDLQTTSNVHYLRKAYKDPITGQDFKLLHMGDVQMSFFGPGGTGLPPNGMTGNPGAAAGAGFSQTATGAGVGLATPGAQSSDGASQSDAPPSPGDETPGGANNSAAGATSDPSGARGSGGQGNPNSGAAGASGSSSPQTFGGGPIVGVASTSKAKSIRQFNKKDHYNQWQFIYDPSADRGGLLSTPNQPALQGASQVGQPVGDQSGSGQSNFGQTGAPGTSGGGGLNQSNPSPAQPAPQPPPQTPDQQQ